MQKKIEEITQYLTSIPVSGTSLLSGISGQILTCSELFLQKKCRRNGYHICTVF
jgi:hypothetical protein